MWKEEDLINLKHNHTCMVLLLVNVTWKSFHSQRCSTTCAKTTCPFPQAPAIWVPSIDHVILNMLPVLGFSKAYDHWGRKNKNRINLFQKHFKEVSNWTYVNILGWFFFKECIFILELFRNIFLNKMIAYWNRRYRCDF